ncbi:MAG: hypothetical protein RR555_09595 [Bacteroidales bacterium]
MRDQFYKKSTAGAQGVVGMMAVLLFCTCAQQKQIKELTTRAVRADVAIASAQSDSQIVGKEVKEITVRDMRGNSVIMNAVKDEQSGEMIATDVLDEIVVEATFRNIAERHGKVDIAFEIKVPPGMQNPVWQVRFRPCFFVLQDTLYSDQVHITGEKYREAQLKGYELYRKFLSTIIPDSCDFVHSYCYQNLLRIFIDRNCTILAQLRNDSTEVDTAVAENLIGVTERQAIEHYTKSWLVNRNNRRKLRKDKMYHKYIKEPLITKGVRLDSVITSADGTIRYHYVQTVQTIKGLRKIDMVVDGEIYAAGKKLYTMPQTDPLTFYISSMSAFTDSSSRYITNIVERNLNVNTAAYLDFTVGTHILCDTFSNNATEIMRIKGNIADILSNEEYVADSLIIIASCSPEGRSADNLVLARKRAASIKKYFERYITGYTDSLRNQVWEMEPLAADDPRKIDIRTRWVAEEWGRLESLIQTDTCIGDLPYMQHCFAIEDLDKREKAMQAGKDYKYIRSVLYPYLRTVKFDFFLHRKGVLKDTVHTTTLDTAYMAGMQALRDRNYKTAIEKLRPYNDYNTAIAYVCLDYNQSALSILELLPKSAKRDYMLAVVYSRLGTEDKAVQMYLHACNQDPAMRFRGNLDPEISQLIKKYNVNTDY